MASILRVFVRHVAPLGVQGDLPDVNTNSARRTVVSERIPLSKYPWVKLAGSHQSLLEPAFTKTNQRLKHVMNEFGIRDIGSRKRIRAISPRIVPRPNPPMPGPKPRSPYRGSGRGPIKVTT